MYDGLNPAGSGSLILKHDGPKVVEGSLSSARAKVMQNSASGADPFVVAAAANGDEEKDQKDDAGGATGAEENGKSEHSKNAQGPGVKKSDALYLKRLGVVARNVSDHKLLGALKEFEEKREEGKKEKEKNSAG